MQRLVGKTPKGKTKAQPIPTQNREVRPVAPKAPAPKVPAPKVSAPKVSAPQA